MDIHKPKPWHGFREFAKEYLIIVIGVLTALAAEAVVENIHWAERTRQTEDHLREKLHTLGVYALERLALQPCTDAMLDKLTARLEEGGDDFKAPFVFSSAHFGKGVVVAQRRTWLAQDWNAALADGTANHLHKEKLLDYSRAFEWVDRLKTISDREETDVSDVYSLASVRKLDPASRAAYLRAVYRMREDGIGMGVYSNNLLAAAKRLGIAAPTLAEAPGDHAGYVELCRRFQAGEAQVGN